MAGDRRSTNAYHIDGYEDLLAVFSGYVRRVLPNVIAAHLELNKTSAYWTLAPAFLFDELHRLLHCFVFLAGPIVSGIFARWTGFAATVRTGSDLLLLLVDSVRKNEGGAFETVCSVLCLEFDISNLVLLQLLFSKETLHESKRDVDLAAFRAEESLILERLLDESFDTCLAVDVRTRFSASNDDDVVKQLLFTTDRTIVQ